MRIIGGAAAKTSLKAPKSRGIRPISDFVKQAIFNSLGNLIEGKKVLELFAGTGSIGLECLSRGASLVVAIESNYSHASFIRKNLELTKLPKEKLQLRVQDVFTALNQLYETNQIFDLVFADPPFGEKTSKSPSHSIAQKLLNTHILKFLLSADGLFILRHARWQHIIIPPYWNSVRLFKHGDSVTHILKPS